MSKVAAAITSPATKATKQENSTMSRRSIRIRASPFHLFCAGRLASAKVRPLQSPDSRMMKLAKRPNPAPPAGGPAYYNPCVVVLRPSSRSFAETRTRVPKNANGIAAHCTETCAELSGVK